MPIPVTVWKCEHCQRRRLASKTKIKKHEKECWFNPVNKTCVTCTNYDCEIMHVRTSTDHPVLNCKDWTNEIDTDEVLDHE